jgi:hypothetical protein
MGYVVQAGGIALNRDYPYRVSPTLVCFCVCMRACLQLFAVSFFLPFLCGGRERGVDGGEGAPGWHSFSPASLLLLLASASLRPCHPCTPQTQHSMPPFHPPTHPAAVRRRRRTGTAPPTPAHAPPALPPTHASRAATTTPCGRRSTRGGRWLSPLTPPAPPSASTPRGCMWTLRWVGAGAGARANAGAWEGRVAACTFTCVFCGLLQRRATRAAGLQAGWAAGWRGAPAAALPPQLHPPPCPLGPPFFCFAVPVPPRPAGPLHGAGRLWHGARGGLLVSGRRLGSLQCRLGEGAGGCEGEREVGSSLRRVPRLGPGAALLSAELRPASAAAACQPAPACCAGPTCTTSPRLLLPRREVKNSWSTHWGDRGYFRVSRDVRHACGVPADAAYAVVA